MMMRTRSFIHSFFLPTLAIHEKKTQEPSQKVKEEEGERKGKSKSKSDDAQENKNQVTRYIPF